MINIDQPIPRGRSTGIATLNWFGWSRYKNINKRWGQYTNNTKTDQLAIPKLMSGLGNFLW